MKRLFFAMLFILPLLADAQTVIRATLASNSATVMIPAADIRKVDPEGSGSRILRSNNLTAYVVTENVSVISSRSKGMLYKFTDSRNVVRAVGKNWIKDVVVTAGQKAQITVWGVSGGYVTSDTFPDVVAGIQNQLGTSNEFAELQIIASDPDTITADTFNYRSGTRIEDYNASVSSGEWTISTANGTITYTGADSILVLIHYDYSLTHSTATSSAGVTVAADGTVITEAQSVQGTATGVRGIVSHDVTKWVQPDEAIDARASGAANGTVIIYSGTFRVSRL